MSVSKFVNNDLGLNLTVFEQDDGSLLFKGKEVAEILGYVNASKAVATHVSEEYRIKLEETQKGPKTGPFCRPLKEESQGGPKMGIPSIDLQGMPKMGIPLNNQQPRTNMITEPGFYELVFSSRLPSAISFRKWVFEEVLPCIRKTGEYRVSGALLKFNAITDKDIAEIKKDESLLIELKRRMDRRRDEIKDDTNVRRGGNGGRKTQENRRKIIEENERLRKRIRELEEETGRKW